MTPDTFYLGMTFTTLSMLVVGGMGSLSGAVAAGLAIGAASALLQAGLPAEARPFRDAFLYGGVILVLLFRPQGLFAPVGSKPRV